MTPGKHSPPTWSKQLLPTASGAPRWLGVALLVGAVGLAAYANSFSVPFQYDDRVVIVGEPAVTEFAPSPLSRRFLGDLSFAISYRLHGTRTFGYHAANLLIHVINAVLLWLIVRLLFRTEPLRGTASASRSEWVALVASLLFVAHPINTQAVTYIAQRYASLAALFFLAAVAAFLAFRLASSRRAAWGWYGVFLATSLAAFWTKENTAVLPLVILLVEAVFFTGALRRRVLPFLPFLLGFVGAVALAATRGIGLAEIASATRVDTAMGRADYLLTQTRVVATYLRLLVAPYGQNLLYDYPISTSIREPQVLLALGLHLALAATALLSLDGGARREPAWRLVGFGIAWFYCTLLVESSIIPIVDVIYEHRVYLPGVGLFMAFSAALVCLPSARTARLRAAAIGAVIVTLAALTFARNRVWHDDVSLWSDVAAKSPHLPTPYNNLGNAFLERGEPVTAIPYYRRALAEDPGYFKAYFNLGEALQTAGQCAAAIPYFRLFASAYPDYPDSYRRLAACYRATGASDLATFFDRAYADIESRRGGRALPPAYR